MFYNEHKQHRQTELSSHTLCRHDTLRGFLVRLTDTSRRTPTALSNKQQQNSFLGLKP